MAELENVEVESQTVEIEGYKASKEYALKQARAMRNERVGSEPQGVTKPGPQARLPLTASTTWRRTRVSQRRARKPLPYRRKERAKGSRAAASNVVNKATGQQTADPKVAARTQEQWDKRAAMARGPVEAQWMPSLAKAMAKGPEVKARDSHGEWDKREALREKGV